jgi:Zinc finger, ZZ type
MGAASDQGLPARPWFHCADVAGISPPPPGGQSAVSCCALRQESSLTAAEFDGAVNCFHCTAVSVAPRGRRALYHCNYCQADISNTVRIKCAVCPDFDLCLECFSVGVEITPHRNDHAYRVVDNLSFPLFQLGWGVRPALFLWSPIFLGSIVLLCMPNRTKRVLIAPGLHPCVRTAAALCLAIVLAHGEALPVLVSLLSHGVPTGWPDSAPGTSHGDAASA